jgi:dolichyl-phosphate beta-glucosyltransferase
MISLIFPAYNESARITETVNEAVDFFEAHKHPYEIIVSADGKDGTRELVADLGKSNPRILAIGTNERLGKGNGIRQAIKIARGDTIGFSDTDNKTPTTEPEKILPKLQEGFEIVIGSRGHHQSKIERPQPWFRRYGSIGFAVFMHLVTGLWDINDTQCGFKFFKGNVARHLFSIQQINGYMFDVEILYLARKAGYRISQVPVHWRDDGDSRLELVSGNIRNFKDIISIRFRHYPHYKSLAVSEKVRE